MDFLDRAEELRRLNRLANRGEGGLAVVYGRRRLGKTRLLLEWVAQHDGLYSVADQSVSEVQRAYFSQAVGQRLPGFGDVTYPDWRALLERLAREAEASNWRGPLVFDELPYLVSSAPELPSVLQRWIDHDARRARLLIAVAGSSQRMMQGLVLDRSAPLYGRAHEILEIRPLEPGYLHRALDLRSARDRILAYSAWGGVPWYWELASEVDGDTVATVDELVLDPQGPLHREPDRLLLEELPPAMEVRPVLDAIGAGAHRVSEVGGRIGRQATSLARPLERLIKMGLVRREVPFGEPPRRSKRSLYNIADPFMRLWFRVVAPNRAALAVATKTARLGLLGRAWKRLVADAWEDLCRQVVPRLPTDSAVGAAGPWGTASRWWWRERPEWDVVAESLAANRLLLGEVRWSSAPMNAVELRRLAREVAERESPTVPSRYADHEVIRVLFVPEVTRRPRAAIDGAHVVTGAEVVPTLG